MPLGPNVRYRMKNGVRLAFKGGKVIEAKNMSTGDTHTPAEFEADRARTTPRKPNPFKRAKNQLLGVLRKNYGE